MIAAARERGTPVPPSLRDAPIPEDAYQTRVFEAFETLCSCRTYTMGGPGPIPWTAIDQFASRNGFDGDEVALGDFVYLIQSLDEEYLQMEAERRKKEEKQRGSSPGVRKASAKAGRRRGAKR